MEAYSLKQLFGGFLLLLIFIILFVVNITYNSPGLNINMFLNPILIVLSICIIIYVINLNETIKLKKKELNKKDTFKLETCPNNYTKNTEMTEVNGVKFKNVSCNSDIYPTFHLNGDEETCGKDGQVNDERGCFNRYSLRKTKCEKIKELLKDNEDVLDNWVEYNNYCNS